MSDTTPTPEATPVPAAPVAAPQETFSLEYVQQLRGEAAKYRTEKKDAVDAALAKAAEDSAAAINAEKGKYTELQGQFSAKEIAMAKLQAAIALEDENGNKLVPTSKLVGFADLIKGTTEEEISTSAQSVLDLVGGFGTKPQPATDPTQGKGGGTLPLNGDPILQALKKAVGA